MFGRRIFGQCDSMWHNDVVVGNYSGKDRYLCSL